MAAAALIITTLACSRPGVRGTTAPAPTDGPWAIHAAIVTDTGARDGWVLFDRTGIHCVDCSPGQIPPDARRLEYDGYLFPNLIDTHNHAHWNVIPQWRAGRTFNSRYEWLTDSAYLTNVNSLYRSGVSGPGLYDTALAYAEVRAVIGATTTIQTSYQGVQPALLARNLDASYGADSRIQDITAITDDEVNRFRSGLSSGRTRRVFLHIGEGRDTDPKSRSEFAYLRGRGLVRPGVVVIHGVALGRAEFEAMAANGMFLVWSPKSNEVLYGATAKVDEALKAGVTVALAPDWTITGSDNALEEMKVAADYSKRALGGSIAPQQIFRMVTCDAARAAGVDERLGRIAFGYAADVFLAPRLHADPFVSLLATEPRHIHLVFLDGVPVYGDKPDLAGIHGASAVDDLTVDGTVKAILMTGDPAVAPRAHQRYADVVRVMSGAIPNLAPLIEP
jgi:cytosine/adenosine deaminase-related metal-dependent hydrolase